MSLGCLLLVAICAASLWQQVAAQGDWSGLVNSVTQDFDFQCPDGAVVVGLASLFRTAQLDRQWEYQCGAGEDSLANVSSATCTLQPAIDAVGDDIEFVCPGNSYIGGFQSEFVPSVYDRRWTPYCCERPFAALVDCVHPTSGWENDIRDTLNFSAPVGHVVAGITSFFFNRDRRWRFRTCAIEVNCTDPGTPPNSQRSGTSFLFGDSVTYTCNHGYYQSEGPEGGVRTCQINGLWSDTPPVCTACTAIENCADIRCTNSSDQLCHECQSHTGEALGEAAYRNLLTECFPLCSWLQGFCYPGSCSDGPSSCNCSSGFAGPDCLDIMVRPALLSCSLTLWSPSQQLQVDCSLSSQSQPLFTNILPHEIRAEWTADFVGPTPSEPAYVEGYAVGVASSDIHTFLFRAANPLDPVSMVTLPCSDPSPSPDSPVPMSMCTSVASSAHLTNHTFLHGDLLVAETTVVNGGYLDIRNLDTLVTHRHYYTGTPTVGVAEFTLDMNPPVHCSLTPSTPCIVGQLILDLGPGITDNSELDVSWGGWHDNPAGVLSYTLEVFRLTESDGVLRESLSPMATVAVNDSGDINYRWSVNVSEGAFSIVMRTLDLAGNSRHSRSLILVDYSSELVIDNSTSLRVDSAVPATGFLWVNSTTAPIVISGQGHFYNTHLRLQDLLAPVTNFTPAVIATEYDHPLEEGLYPRGGTENALGVTQLRYEVTSDSVGGASLISEPEFFSLSTSDLGLEAAVLETGELTDGDSVRVWFQAWDYVNHIAVDSVLFHVDSSPPELDNLWLEWNGVSELSLHGTESLLDLEIHFQTSDPHSGILSLQYWIGMRPHTSDVAWGQIPVQRVAAVNCSSLPLCVCSSLSNCSLTQYTFSPLTSHFSSSHVTLHDTEYYITVTATNHAHLVSSLTYKFTTDITPPLTGIAMDTIPGSHDLDYTSNSTIVGSWNHFFDRETSVLQFQYHFGTECLNKSYFMYPLPEESVVMETDDLWASWTTPGSGTYFVTVAAINHALQPSYPACSDGITVDQSPPLISNIVIPATVETAGQMFISTDGHVNVSWEASDNVGVREFHIATLSSQGVAQGQSPNFTSTGRQPFFSLVNSELLSNGNAFYVFVKATDLALNENKLSFGPVVVDVTPPVVRGNLTVETSQDQVMLTWFNDTFTDEESGVISLDFSLGSSAYGEQVLQFDSVPTFSPLCLSAHCLSLTTSPLHLLSGHTYYLTLRARNAAGLESFLTADGFTHIHGTPTGGRVVDLDPHNLDHSSENGCISLHGSDTDLVVDSDWVAAQWEGFDHAHLNVTFSVGLGSVPGRDDVVPFTWVGMETQHTFTNLTLVPGENYYFTVIASNDYGITMATSDGFAYLSGINDAVSMVTVVDGNEEGRDIDYQYSASSLGAQWVCPPHILPYVSHFLWAILSGDPLTSSQLTPVWEYQNVGSETWAIAGGLELKPGEMYISAVQVCLSTPIPTCLAPAYSDGVSVLDQSDVSQLYAIYTPLEWNPIYSTSSYGKLDIQWSPFQDAKIAYYEWAIGTGEPAHELLTEWSSVEWYETSLTVYLNTTISLHKNNTVTLQGYNWAGLHSRTAVALSWNVDGEAIPQHRVPRSKLIVYDIPQSEVREPHTTDWREIEYSEWDPVGIELDYTSSAHSLSAAWPDLRYTSYNYSVSTSPIFTSCSTPGSGLACGSTIANSVTIPDLHLQNGMRYYVCIQTQRSFAIHTSSSSPLTLTACSNGVTVDLAPPTGTCVQIQPQTPEWESDLASGVMASGSGDFALPGSECASNGSQFQTSSSDLYIVWSPFHDVEWYGNAVHSSGVAYYEYAVGSAPGLDDVVPFTDVGVVNDVITTGIHLQSGHTYFATVRGHDFTSQWSDVTSPGVTVDLTPPTSPSQFTLVNRDSTYSSIPLISDGESGVREMKITLGSRPGSSNLLEWTDASYGDGMETYIDQAGIEDGQVLFATVQVHNGAGLSSQFFSLGHTHDSTPPEPGTVYDTSHDESHDQDYTSSLSELSARWTQWSDPHTPVVEYLWAIGSGKSVNDVQDFLSVGVATVARRKGLSLVPGTTYYVTVRGCNLIGQCTEASSNGITVDVTPPTSGWIMDGLRGGDQQYQSSRSYIAAHWSGFHDSESLLQSYVISAGTLPGDESFVPSTRLAPSSSFFVHYLSHPLPNNITVYVNLIAINNAGGETTASSNGVLIDDLAPVISNVSIDTQWAGSVAMETQFSNSALRAMWISYNTLSPIRDTWWSILSYPGTAIPRDTENVNSQDSGTASRLSLKDGVEYSVSVATCSAAGLCSQSETNTLILVDGSPPVDGFFAVETDSTFPRSAAVPGGMAWRNRPRAGDSRITLSFYGFSDIHSGISSYWVEIGSGFGQFDLTQGPVKIHPTEDTATGSLSATVATESHVMLNQTLYLSLWAINGVGLPSRRAQSSFLVEEGEEENRGTLRHVRSSLCPLESCLGHCTCAARDDLCPLPTSHFAECEEVVEEDLIEDERVVMTSVSPQQPAGDVLFTAITDKLLGRWEIPDHSPFQRLEWTVGRKGESPGSGLFDISTDQIWKEAGNISSAIFSINPLYPLVDGETYAVYVRGWLNFTHFTVFESDGVIVDTSGPQVIPGGRVREGGSGTKVDHTANQTTIEVSWNGVFISQPSAAHSSYQIGIGDVPGSDNVIRFSLAPPGFSSASLSGQLSHGRRYFTTLRATGPHSLITDSISNGFIVDTTPPEVGVVLDGRGYSDELAQSGTSSLSARWTSFHDAESGIHHYEIAWSTSSTPALDLDYEDVGIGLSWTMSGLELDDGSTYYIHLAAVNGAGVWSQVVSTNGITVDISQPQQLQCQWEALNLTSSEPISSGVSPCDEPLPRDVESGITKLYHSATFSPLSGCFSQLLSTSHTLTVPTSPDSLYTLSFWLAQQPVGSGCGQLTPLGAKVTAPGVEEVVLVHTWNGDMLTRWNRFQFQFTADNFSSILMLSPLSDQYQIVLDNLVVSQCHTVDPIPITSLITNRSSVFHIAQEHISGVTTRLSVRWELGEVGEDVREYKWAIGMTLGGEQLQPFTSTGSNPYGVSEELSTFHSQSVYVSVVAWNLAGAETVVQGGPFTVDLTPPELTEGGGVWDGVGGVDIDYQSSEELRADWSDVTDPESGIVECAFMIGTAAGRSDLHPHTPTTNTTSLITLTNITHGTHAVTTVICWNAVGLRSTFSSDGVTILQAPPTNDSAYLAISSPLMTVYRSRDNHVASANVTLVWGGFAEPAGHPLHYEVCVGESEGVSCVMVGADRQLIIDGAGVASEEQVVSVTALNLAGLRSVPVQARIVFQTSPPTDNGVPINVTWVDQSTLYFNWSGKFTSTSRLTFELSLGTIIGSGIIQKWVELDTDHTYLTVSDVRLSRAQDYFLTLVAISSSGLHTTASHTEPGLPLDT